MSKFMPENWNSLSKYLIASAVGMIVYVFSMHFSMMLVPPNSSFSVFFIPAGFACAFALILGYRFLPLIFLAKIIYIYGFSNIGLDKSLLRNLITCASSAFQASIAIYIFNAYRNKFGEKYSYLLCIVLAIFAPIISSGTGVLGTSLDNDFNFALFFNEFFTMYTGDALAILVVVPIFINYIDQKHIKSFDYLVPIFTLIVSYIFIYDYVSAYIVVAYIILIIPLILGSNLGVSLAVLTASVFFNWTNVHNLPPFSQSIFADNLKTIQMFILSLSFISISLMALKKEKILRFFIFPFMVIWLFIGIAYNVNYNFRTLNNKAIIDDKVAQIQQTIDAKIFSINLALNSNEAFVTVKKDFTQEEWMRFHRTLESNLKINIVKGFAYINLERESKKDNKTLNVIDSHYNSETFMKILDEPFLEKYYFLSFQQDGAFLTPTLGLQIGPTYDDEYKKLSFLVKSVKKNDKVQGIMIMFVDISRLFDYSFNMEFKHYNIDVFNVLEGVEAQKVYTHHDEILKPRGESKNFISSLKIYNGLYYVHWHDTFNFFINYEYSSPLILLVGSLLIFIISFFILNKKIITFKEHSDSQLITANDLHVADKFKLIFDSSFEKILIFNKDEFIQANNEALKFFNKKSLHELKKVSPFSILNLRSEKSFANSDYFRSKITEVNIHKNIEFSAYFIQNANPIQCDIKLSHLHTNDSFLYAIIFKESIEVNPEPLKHNEPLVVEKRQIPQTKSLNTRPTNEEVSETATEDKNSEESVFNGERILLVEDNEVNVFVTKKFLDRWGLKTDVAENGLIAIEKIKNNNYDLVLMDLHMPIMDGFEATRIIRTTHPFLTIIGLSADVLNNSTSDYQKIGLDDFLTKPFRSDDFLRILHLYLTTVS